MAGIPRFKHEEHDPDTDRVLRRGTGRVVEYSCKYCPARGPTPGEIRCSPSCPMAGDRGE